MNKNRWMRACFAAILALTMAAGATLALLGGMEIAVSALHAYLPALIAAIFCVFLAQGGVFALCSAGAAAVSIAVACFSGGAARELVNALRSGESGAISAQGNALAAVISCLLSASFFALLYRKGGTLFAISVMGVLTMVAYALNSDMPIGIAVPGLIAAVVAFAADGRSIQPADFARALVPAVLSVAIAVLLLPGEGATWKPLRDAAAFVRQVFEEYFHFTEERIPFSINAEGYDHAAEVNGLVEARLGGPANPDSDPVMRVTANADLLLRGSIRRTYTGGAWVDNTAKSRYLYLDFTRAGVREKVLGMESVSGFASAAAKIEFLAPGTSTLFVPGNLADFSMDAQNAVYYNSIGEIFLTRAVQAGDRYSVQALIPNEAAIRAQMNDSIDEGATEGCLQLPESIESGVYALTAEITQSCAGDYDKALAIEAWLKQNCVYTLSPDYPKLNRDFVSQFVLDTREGYCSYFASAMTVMCRIAGVPARYVEGYYARMNGADSVVLTGENAHAWTEVYIGGVGWTAFNPSGGDAADSDESGNPEPTKQPDNSTPEPTEQPESGDPNAPVPPESDPTIPPDDGSATSEPTQSPTLPPNAAITPPPSNSQIPPEAQSAPENRSGRGFGWWILIILLILLAIAAIAFWISRRLRAADPMRLIAGREINAAMLILYRSCLTLLGVKGLYPMNDESPVPFAERVNAISANEDFVPFARAIERIAYARAEADKSSLAAGKRAYQTFARSLTIGEKIKFTIRRLFKGLGDFTAIP